MNINFYETQKWEEEYLINNLPGHNLRFFSSPLSDNVSVSDDVDVISVFVGSRVSEDMLAGLPNLKFIATRSTGFDHINISACKARGILVSNVPAYGENTVAEFTFALILELSRKMYQAVKRVREQGEFSSRELLGFDLAGKTLGVIGTGHIGAWVCQIANGFGMKIVAYDVHKNTTLVRKFKVKYLDLPALLAESDIITLHAPYIPATHHLLNSSNINLIKPGALLINTARGALIETESLVEALRSGRIAGAGLDVLEEEGHIGDEAELISSSHPKAEELKVLLADHALMQMENVIITPHTAFNTKEAMERILSTTITNIQSFISGTPANTV